MKFCPAGADQPVKLLRTSRSFRAALQLQAQLRRGLARTAEGQVGLARDGIHAQRLPQVLSVLSPTDPQLARIVEGHLLPFLASVPSRPRRARTPRPIPLGQPASGGDTTAIVPCNGFARLQPMLALLAGTPEAEALELCLVASREVASEMLPRLEDAFGFYGLSGQLVVASDLDGLVLLGPIQPGSRVLRVGDSITTPTLLVPFDMPNASSSLDRPVFLPSLESGINGSVPTTIGCAMIQSDRIV